MRKVQGAAIAAVVIWGEGWGEGVGRGGTHHFFGRRLGDALIYLRGDRDGGNGATSLCLLLSIDVATIQGRDLESFEVRRGNEAVGQPGPLCAQD